MNNQPYSFTTGDTDPVGDCGKFEAGINVNDWLQRIVVYGDTPADAEALRDQLMAEPLNLRSALEHIIKTVGQSRTQTRRLRWIGKRAELALAGRPYVAAEHELPPNAETEHGKLLVRNGRLRIERDALQARLNVSDQRIDELEGLLRRAEPYIPRGRFGSVPYQWHLEVDDALKPTAEAESHE